MREKDITIAYETTGSHNELSAFRIGYRSRAQMAQQVVTQLTSLFIDQNIQEQAQQSENTTDFLSSELEDARNQLGQQEGKIKEFKAQHMARSDADGKQSANIRRLQERHAN